MRSWSPNKDGAVGSSDLPGAQQSHGLSARAQVMTLTRTRGSGISPEKAPALPKCLGRGMNLFRAVEPSVKKRAEADGVVPGRVVKFDLMFSKPFPTPAKRK
jgi:hypothetical protein